MGLPVFPQAPPVSRSQGKANLSSERLLQDAYGLSKELPAEDHVWLLAELTMPMAKWHPALTRPWVEEQLRLPQQLSPGDNRLATQKNAATAMSWNDPERALQMLAQCDSPIPSDDSVEDLREVAARRIFKRYLEAWGMRGLGSLQRVADHIGETGEYPYSAMVPVIQEVSRQNSAKGQSLISEALAFYQRGSPFQMTDEDFIAFVKNTKDLDRHDGSTPGADSGDVDRRSRTAGDGDGVRRSGFWERV
jgi:hypothetical protein